MSAIMAKSDHLLMINKEDGNSMKDILIILIILSLLLAVGCLIAFFPIIPVMIEFLKWWM